MKRKFVIAAIILIVIIAAAIYLSQPKAMTDDKNSYEIYRVVYNGINVTGRVDCEELASTVSQYTCGRLPRTFAPYQQSQVAVELNGINGNNSLHILLGDINVACESGKRGFPIKNSEALLNEILKMMPCLTDKELGLKEKNVITFSDGASAELWRPDHSGRDIYKLSNGTVLLTVQDPAGPDNTYAGGVESFDDLSASAQEAVLAFYEKQGLLFDIRSELESAYAEYLICQESETEYHARYISQDITPTASNENILCFLTSVVLPVDGLTCQEIHLGAVFDRETGEALSNWDLFALPEEEARQWLLNAFDVDSALRAEMDAALKPEYIILFPDHLEVSFPQGTLPSRACRYGNGFAYDELKSVLQPWAIPDGSVEK